jgi:4-hydroxyphenylacetate 3-monooxygenase
MGIITGRQFLDRICDGRTIYLKGHRLDSPLNSTPLRRVAETIAGLLDMQHDPEHRDVLVRTDPETGESIPATSVIPRSAEDLVARRRAFELWTGKTFGVMGRTPDYMNAFLAALGGCAEAFRDDSDVDFAGNIREYARYVRKNNIITAHCFASLQNNRSHSLAELHSQQQAHAPHAISETKAGLVLRGASTSVTLAPVSDEIVVFSPGRPVTEAEKDFCLAFALPLNTPGLSIVCREPYFGDAPVADHPLAPYDEVDAVVLYDDVLIPWERVFLYRNARISNSYKLEMGFADHIGHQVATRLYAKLNFAVGLANEIAEVLGTAQAPHIQGAIGRLMVYQNTMEAFIRAAEAESAPDKWGVWKPGGNHLWSALCMSQQFYDTVTTTVRDLSASGLINTPAAADFDTPAGGGLQAALGSGTASGDQRSTLFRLAWDFTGHAFAGRSGLYERFFNGDQVRTLARYYAGTDLAPARKAVAEALAAATE